MQSILDAINEWIKEILIGAINGNLSTMFGDVNEKVGTIAAEVGQTPQGWNANIFSMIQTLSENVIVPIAGLVITYVLCYELISMVTEKNNILINRQLDKQTKQMVCGYALGHYLEHQLLMDLHTLNKFLTIKDKHILLYEHNAFTSHLMLDSDEVYQMTKRGLDAAQISAAKRIHLNLVLVKLLELHHLGYDLRHYHAQHYAFIKQFNLPAHFQFDVAAG